MKDEETLARPPRRGEKPMLSSLLLHIRDADGSVFVHPIQKQITRMGLGGDINLPTQPLDFILAGGHLLYRTHGEPELAGQLDPGGYFELVDWRIFLWDRAHPLALLRGCTPPFHGMMYGLPGEVLEVGRPGKRANAIELNHPTVSRSQARLENRAGQWHVVSESETNPVVQNGQPLPPGPGSPLKDGDLLEFGDLLFQFQEGKSAPPPAGLEAQSLGAFVLRVGGQAISDKQYKTRAIKWLAARLCYHWGTPVANEVFMEMLWPEFDPQNARNNFNYSVSTLRKLLRPDADSPDPLLRSSTTLALNPDVLVSHDLCDLRKSLQSEENVAGLLRYPGAFCPECPLEWAEQQRLELQQEWLSAARRALARGPEKTQAVALATQILKVDRSCPESVRTVVSWFLNQGDVAEARRIFRVHEEVLARELQLQPDPALRSLIGF